LSSATDPQFRIAFKDHPDGRRLRLIYDQFAVLDVIAERHVAARPHALAFRRRDLVADALAAISRSNWAKESSILSVNRPLEVVVLNCCVTDTNEALWASRTSTKPSFFFTVPGQKPTHALLSDGMARVSMRSRTWGIRLWRWQ
jgi:hypothetical protein